MKRAIVTDGSGLIGTGICRALVEAGWEVAAFDVAGSGTLFDGVRYVTMRSIRWDA